MTAEMSWARQISNSQAGCAMSIVVLYEASYGSASCSNLDAKDKEDKDDLVHTPPRRDTLKISRTLDRIIPAKPCALRAIPFVQRTHP